MWLKTVIGASAAVVSVGFALGYWIKVGPQQAANAADKRSTRAMCTLSPSDGDRRQQKLAALWARAQDTRDLENGYAFQFAFDDETLKEVTSVISLESRCCSFFEFRITARPAQDDLLLEITGPQGTKELLAGSVSLGASQRRTRERLPQDSGPASCCPGGLPCPVETDVPGGGAK